jgi:hypothetical protein
MNATAKLPVVMPSFEQTDALPLVLTQFTPLTWGED